MDCHQGISWKTGLRTRLVTVSQIEFYFDKYLNRKARDLSNEIFSHADRECRAKTDNIGHNNRKINRTKRIFLKKIGVIVIFITYKQEPPTCLATQNEARKYFCSINVK